MVRELIVKEDPKAPISEIFRTLRTNIQFMNTKNNLKNLLITSTLQGEGKSWISANLAVTFAQAGKRVIVLDADMRKGRQYKIFGISPKPGLSNYLSEVDYNNKIDLVDYIQDTEIDNLYVITAGDVPPNPSELLVSESMIKLMESLKKICDIVIVDGPPTQLVTDSLILARIVDSTVIIAESNKTKKDSIRRIVDNIQKVGGKIAGVVINKMQLSTKKYENSYYYGSTAMTLSKKNSKREKNSKEKITKEEIIQETRKKNNERVRQLVNQNRIKKEENNINESNNNIESKKQANIELETQEMPSFIRKTDAKEKEEKVIENNNNNNETKNKYDLDEKTKEILKQVNEYLENEKRNLNNT